jgi:hypothetical protein
MPVSKPHKKQSHLPPATPFSQYQLKNKTKQIREKDNGDPKA